MNEIYEYIYKRRGDRIREFGVAHALEVIRTDGLAGDMAELGVWRGEMAVLYNKVLPDKRLYLFDTFTGFPQKDFDAGFSEDRFTDTSINLVRSRFNTDADVVIRDGYFPDTASGLEDRRFCFVMLDVDLYKPTLAGLEFFYPRMVVGGYIFAHDYITDHPPFNQGVRRAVDQFLSGKPERFVYLNDPGGSILFRKMKQN